MSTNETGGPAFASGSVTKQRVNQADQGSDWVVKASTYPLNEGMTMRDYFAAKAMQGFASSDEAAWIDGAIGMAKESYAWADAMLKARAS